MSWILIPVNAEAEQRELPDGRRGDPHQAGDLGNDPPGPVGANRQASSANRISNPNSDSASTPREWMPPQFGGVAGAVEERSNFRNGIIIVPLRSGDLRVWSARQRSKAKRVLFFRLLLRWHRDFTSVPSLPSREAPRTSDFPRSWPFQAPERVLSGAPFQPCFQGPWEPECPRAKNERSFHDFSGLGLLPLQKVANTYR